MIKIKKSLVRRDKGTVSSGSLIDFKTLRNTDLLIVRYNLTHWVSQEAKDGNKEYGWLPISGVMKLDYIQIKQCTEEEWASLNNAGSNELIEKWLEELIIKQIGKGFTEII